LSLQLEPVAVSLTSMSSPAAAEPDPLVFVQVFLLVELTVQERSVAPVVLSTTATTALSEPVTDAFVSA
jgi:hypothetical protein